MKLGFYLQISGKRLNITFYEVCPVGIKLFRADGRMDGHIEERTDGQTDMMKIISAFRNFFKAPEN